MGGKKRAGERRMSILGAGTLFHELITDTGGGKGA